MLPSQHSSYTRKVSYKAVATKVPETPRLCALYAPMELCLFLDPVADIRMPSIQ